MAYSFYRSLTIDHTKCGASDSSNFPVTFNGTYSWLATVANGGKAQNVNGYDIQFYSDSALTTALSFEREAYNATTGAVTFWVKIPTLSSSVDTVIYIAYGDSGISTDQSTPTAVWDSNFKGVYHLNQTGSAVTSPDSTSGARTISAASGSTQQTGQVDGAIGVSTTNANSGAASAPNLTLGALTYSVWINANSAAAYAVLGNTAGGNNGTRLGTGVSGSDMWPEYIQGSVAVNDFNNAGMKFQASAWIFMAVTVAAGGAAAIGYMGKAGTLTTQSLTISSTISGTPDRFVVFARDSGNVDAFPGDVDEIRFSASVRSGDWLLQEYNNQWSPSTFYAVGTETAGPGTPVTFIRTDYQSPSILAQ